MEAEPPSVKGLSPRCIACGDLNAGPCSSCKQATCWLHSETRDGEVICTRCIENAAREKRHAARRRRKIQTRIQVLENERLPTVPKHEREPRLGRAWRDQAVVRLLKRDGPFCHWCGDQFESVHSITLEHIKPLSRGGTNKDQNLALVHQECNS